MAFVVEDGTSKTTSNSYASTTAASTYWTDHGNPDAWTSASTSDKQQALMLGTQYLDATYHSRWKGVQTDVDQALDWPRYDVIKRNNDAYDSDEMPQRLIDATCELALKHINGTDLIPDTEYGSIKMKRTKAGPVEVEKEYTGGTNNLPNFRTVDMLIRSGDLISVLGNVYRG